MESKRTATLIRDVAAERRHVRRFPQCPEMMESDNMTREQLEAEREAILRDFRELFSELSNPQKEAMRADLERIAYQIATLDTEEQRPRK